MSRRLALLVWVLTAQVGCRCAADELPDLPSRSSDAGATSSAPPAAVASDCGDERACEAACGSCPQDCPPPAAAACHRLGELCLRGERIDLRRAAAGYRRACEGGRLASCATLALQVQDGRGVPHDKARAVELYTRACDGGIGVGCFNLGLMYESGNGADIDEPRAARYFDQAKVAYERQCAAGELGWCMNLGVLYEQGYGVAADAERAKTIYRKACEGGHGESCVNMALQQVESGAVEQGIALLERTCQGRDRLACSVLGQQCVKGAPGFAKDIPRGEKLLERACRDGAKHACGVLGAVVGMRATTPEEGRRADALEERACDLGGRTACLVLGKQRLGERAWKRAAVFLERACWIGAGEACGQLGALFDRGVGVEQSDARALELFRWGCRLGDPGTCVELIRRDEPLPLPADKQPLIYRGACARGVTRACSKHGGR